MSERGRRIGIDWPCLPSRRAALAVVALLSLPAFAHAQATGGAEAQFRQLSARASDSFLTFTLEGYQECERLLLQASRLGALDTGQLATLCYIRRGFLDRPEDALPVAEFMYQRDPCLRTAIEVTECYADNYDFPKARRFLADFLGIPDGLTPVQALEAIRGVYQSIPSGPERTPLGLLLDRIAVKQYAISFVLNDDYCRQSSRDLIGRLGYHPFSIYPDCSTQHVSYEVQGAERVEESSDGAGNRELKVFSRPGAAPVLYLNVTLVPQAYDIRLTEGDATGVPAEVRRYMRSRPLIDPTGSRAVAVAAEVQGGSRYETLKRLNQWWTGFRYAEPGGEDSESIIAYRSGNCRHWSRAAAAILGAAGIPARQIQTFCLQEAEFGNPFSKLSLGGHWLMEFFDPVHGWIQWGVKAPPAPGSVIRQPERRMTETPVDLIRMEAEDPDYAGPLGNLPVHEDAWFYGWKDDTTDPPDLRNTSVELVGLTLTEPQWPDAKAQRADGD